MRRLLRDAAMTEHDWIFATRITAARTEAAAAERERIIQLATEHRAVYFTGNQKDGVEPHPFADLIKEDE